MEYFIIDFLQKSRVLVFVEIQKNCTQKSDFELKIVLWNQENYQKSEYGQNLNKKQEKRSLTIIFWSQKIVINLSKTIIVNQILGKNFYVTNH